MSKKKGKVKKKLRVPNIPAPKFENKCSKYDECLARIKACDLSSVSWTENPHLKEDITYVLDRLKDENIMFMKQKFCALLISFIHSCEDLYSPILKKNQQLQTLAKQTVVNYYKCNFVPAESRQISFLPLDLRLFIYIEMLKSEITKYTTGFILDRITLTLNKMNATMQYDFSVFMLSWSSLIIFKTLIPDMVFSFFYYEQYKRTKKFSDLLKINNRVFNSSGLVLRDKTLTSAMVDGARRLDQDFWYGVNCFCDLGKIRDIKSAKICLELFSIYFEKVYGFAPEFKELALKYYDTGNAPELEAFKKHHQIDDIEIESYLYNLSNDIEMKQDQKNCEYRATGDPFDEYLYIFPSKGKVVVTFDKKTLPRTVSQPAYYEIMEACIDKIYHGNNIFIPSLEEYLTALSTAMLRSSEWDFRVLYMAEMGVRAFIGVVWANRKKGFFYNDIAENWRTTLLPGLNGNVKYHGFGIPVKLTILPPKIFASCLYETDIPGSCIIRFCESSDEGIEEIIGRCDKNDATAMTDSGNGLDSMRVFELNFPEDEREERQQGWQRIRNFFKSGRDNLSDILSYVEKALSSATRAYEENSLYEAMRDSCDALYVIIKHIVNVQYDIPMYQDYNYTVRALRAKGIDVSTLAAAVSSDKWSGRANKTDVSADNVKAFLENVKELAAYCADGSYDAAVCGD